MEQKPRRRIPRIVMIAVPALALGLALLLVAVAWRSNKTVRAVPAPTEGVSITTEGQNSFLDCTNCHGDLDKVFKEGKVTILKYTHAMHFSKGVSDCSVCHFPNTHEPDKINKPTMSRCFTCHGTTKVAIAPGTCNTCHPPGLPKKPPTHLVADWLPSGHAKEALNDQFQCLTCHQQSFCQSCHGVTMPHSEDWAGKPHTVAFFADANTCQRCHRRAPDIYDFCDTCHHPQDPKNVPWREFHHNVVVNRGADTCFQCHSETTCSACHLRGEEDFSADRYVKPTPVPSPSGG